MKKHIKLLAFSVLMITAVAFTASTSQQDKNKNRKENQRDQKNDPQDKDKGKDNRDDDREDDRDDKNGKDKNDHKHIKHAMHNAYKWDHENFKERKKIKDQEKVTLCHKFRKNDEPAVSIRVSSHAKQAHLDHGDIIGDCPADTSHRYSDKYLRNRADYYNRIQDHYEQLVYSRSILDYAEERLAWSNQQLVILQNNKAAADEIARKQAVVRELENNVTLLKTLAGVAATLVVVKLQ